MIKLLKVTMILYAVIGILFGLAFIFAPNQLDDMFGHEASPAHVTALAAELGISFVSVGIFFIIAARDPLKYILWVKYAIVFALLMLATGLYSFIRGDIGSEEAVAAIIIHAVFAAALLTFYPWRAASRAD